VRLVLSHLGQHLTPTEEDMSSTVPNPASPDPADPSSQQPRTRREATSTWSATATSSGWSGALIAMGIISVILGVLVLVWPKATLLVVAITFGLQLIVAGAVRLSVSRDLPSDPGWLKPVSIGLGVLSIIAGIICLFRPGTSLLVIAIFIAVGWIAEGIAALAQGFGSDRTTGARVFLIVMGVVSILGGLIVAIFPGSSLVVLTRIAGIALIVIGIAELVAAFMARRAAGTGAGTGSTAAPSPA
jgi:uncharacterized membrane protein HdeD (DUF308 family)